MQKEPDTPLVSIVIPCYNAEKYVLLTVESVLNQSFTNFELLIVNDGSTDNTESLINKIQDSRIIYIKKNNTGVSDSRNKGLYLSKGNYILFLDADDILSSDFLEKRIIFLLQNTDLGFCSSVVIKIDENGNKIIDKTWRGVALNILQEILSYNEEIITCPSNYLFRKNVLTKHGVKFSTDLSSSADRYFLIELANFTKGGLIQSGGILFYRVHNFSMSNNLTQSLINDNLLFQKKILQLGGISKELRKEFCFRTNYIFAGSYFKLKKIPQCIWYAIHSFYFNPIVFIKQFFN